jgi:molybdate transport system ATP-binding protein
LSIYIDIEKVFPDFKLTAQMDCEDEVVALLGSSGCGKSLTLKCIAGIEKPTKGRIIINGETVFDSRKRINIPPQNRNIGYLFQNYALFPTMTVWNNISCIIKKPKKEKAGIVDNMIGLFHLQNVKNLYPGEISGGQQQRVALARMLVSEPKILLLDEPFSALDSHLRWKVEQEITSVLAEFRGTTILVSHDRGEAYRISNKIAVMSRGKIESIGAKKDIFSSPRTLAAALITGCKNISKAKKLGENQIEALDWGITLKTKTTVHDNVKYIAVRAHHFQQVGPASGKNNIFPCFIHRIIEEPFKKIVIFSFGSNTESSERLQFTIQGENDGELDLEKLFLAIPEDKILCLEN